MSFLKPNKLQPRYWRAERILATDKSSYACLAQLSPSIVSICAWSADRAVCRVSTVPSRVGLDRFPPSTTWTTVVHHEELQRDIFEEQPWLLHAGEESLCRDRHCLVR
jgi:hypothetical protein